MVFLEAQPLLTEEYLGDPSKKKIIITGTIRWEKHYDARLREPSTPPTPYYTSAQFFFIFLHTCTCGATAAQRSRALDQKSGKLIHTHTHTDPSPDP